MARLTSPALRRGLDILELLIDEGDGLRVPEITKRLQLPRATTHELVNTLVDRGYVTISKETGLVKLGLATLQLGAGYERGLELASVGRECARAVAAECGETVQVVIRDGASVVFIVRVDSTHTVRLISQVGTRLAASCTAGGKMMLSLLSPNELDALIPDDSHLVAMTPQSISTRARLDDELALIRARGWAREDSESNPHVTCIAAPVYDRFGACIAAMSISVPIVRWVEAEQSRFVQRVREGAAAISRQLGGRASA